MKNKFIAAVLFLLFVMSFGTVVYGANRYINLNLTYDGKGHSYIAEEVFLNVDGEKLENLSMPPIILDSWSLVPAREVFEKTGAVVSWNPDREEVYVSRGSDFLVLKINSTTAFYNNKEADMSIPAKLINSKTMIPVRFVSETLGYDVVWENPTRTIYIDSDGSTPQSSDTQTSEATTDSAAEPAPETAAAPASPTPSDEYNVISMGIDKNGLPKELFELSDANHFDCNIVDISAGEDYSYLKITADDEISRIKTSTVSGDRYYLDFYGANTGMGKVKMQSYVTGITEVRMAHRTENGVNITRVAMDITRSDFTVKMTADRKTVYIYYPSSEINDYKLVSDIAEDIFTVSGHDLTKPDVKTTKTSIIMTFGSTKLDCVAQVLKRNSRFVDSAEIKQSGSDTIITFTLKDTAAYKTTYGENSTSITIYKTSYQNMNADSDTLTLAKKSGQSFSLSSVAEEDDYNNLKYTITLPGDFSATYGTGDMVFESSERLNSVNISVKNGKTTLVFDEKMISAFDITEDSDNIYISCVDLHKKYDKVVVIDAGHGGSDVGTSANGIVEKEATLDIVLKIKDLLDKDGTIKAYYTRLTDFKPSLAERAAFGNKIDCPFVSVHINSAGANNPDANGVEVYWLNENTNEDGLKSSVLAKTIYDNMLKRLGTNGRGVKTANYQVLRESRNPASLIEVCFVTNPAEAAKLKTDSFKEDVAKAVVESLKSVL